MKEEWKDIKGFEGKYKISNLGNVKSLNYCNTGKERILKPLEDKCGYLKINLYNKRCYTYSIHRLVAEHFITLPKLEVNHIDGNKHDNSIQNLEWCTHAENERHFWRILKKKKVNKKRNHRKAVIQYDLENNYIKKWESATEAAKTLKIRLSKICDCCRGERNKTGGFRWRYEEYNTLP